MRWDREMTGRAKGVEQFGIHDVGVSVLNPENLDPF
jgi:hypothetical protein